MYKWLNTTGLKKKQQQQQKQPTIMYNHVQQY